MNRRRLAINCVSVVLLLLSIGAAIAWGLSKSHPALVLTSRWEDQGSSISNSVHAIGFDKDGLFWNGVAEICYPDDYPHRLEIREFFQGLGPPNITRIRCARSEISFVGQSSLNPYLFGAGSTLFARRVGLSFPETFFLLMALPIVWTSRSSHRWHQRRTRARHGRCTECAFDLTGNTSGVCPECGTTILRKSEAVA